jgi:hypothetical protein
MGVGRDSVLNIKKEAGISQMTKIQRNAKPTYPGVSPSRARKNDVEDDSGALELPCLSRCDDASELLQFKFDKNMVQRQNDRRRTTPKLCGG